MRRAGERGGGFSTEPGGKYKNLAISKTLEGRKEGEGMEERGEIGVSGAHFATRSPPNQGAAGSVWNWILCHFLFSSDKKTVLFFSWSDSEALNFLSAASGMERSGTPVV